MLPQIPSDNLENRPDEFHAAKDNAVCDSLRWDLGWILDDTVTSLTDQQSADILWAITTGMTGAHDLDRDWIELTNIESRDRLALFRRAVAAAGSALREAFADALVKKTFRHIRNAGAHRSCFWNSHGCLDHNSSSLSAASVCSASESGPQTN